MIIAVINYILFLILFKISIRDNSSFFLINLGGMVIRIIIMLVLIFIVVKFLKVDEYRFIFAFFIMYFLLLINELYIVISTLSRKSYGKHKDVIR